MNGDRVAAVAIALVCVLAVAVTATSLSATVTTDPEDGLDFDDGSLPIRQEDADEVADALETAIDDLVNWIDEVKPTEETEPQPVTPSEPQDVDLSDLDLEGGAAGQGATSTPTPEPARDSGSDIDLIEALLDLPRWLLSVLPVLGPVVLVLGYRYADRLQGLLAILHRKERPARRTPVEEGWSDAEPRDEISRAWFAMVRRVEIDRPRSKTPEECARIAVAAGLDPEAVATITRAFKAVRYGGAPPTDERRRRVRDALRELGIDEADSEGGDTR